MSRITMPATQVGSLLVVCLLLLSLFSVTPLAAADEGESGGTDAGEDGGPAIPDGGGGGGGGFAIDAGGPYAGDEGSPIIFEGSALSIFSTSQDPVVTDPAEQGGSVGSKGQSVDISGNIVVWQDFRNGNWDIYASNLDTGEEFQLTNDLNDQKRPAIDGNRIVWEGNDVGNFDIYLYEFESDDIANGVLTPVTTHTAGQFYADIAGDIITWYDWRHQGEVQNPPRGAENTEIYMYNRATGAETRVTSGPDHTRQDVYARVFGDTIVYQSQDPVSGSWELHLYDIESDLDTTVPDTPSGNNQFPDIDGDLVVYQSVRGGYWTIYLYDITTGEHTQLSSSGSYHEWYPRIAGDKVVWESNRNNPFLSISCFEEPPGHEGEPINCDIVLYDLSAAVEQELTDNENGQFRPAVSGDVMVWTDNRDGNFDIYMQEFDLSTDFTLEWDFDYDGTSFDTEAEGETATFTYADDFAGAAALRAITPGGVVSLATTSVTVTNVVPTADAGGLYSGIEGIEMIFDASGSSDPGTDELTYVWNYGDGTVEETTSPRVTHIYLAEGDYPVTLTVSDDDGGFDTATVTVPVLDADPIAAFGVGAVIVLPGQSGGIGDGDDENSQLEPREDTDDGGQPETTFTVLEGEPITFLDMSSSVDGIIAWTWNFGDGATSTEQNPSHVFTAPGDYFVTLTVEEADGDTASAVNGFTVQEDTTVPEISNITFDPPLPLLTNGSEQTISIDFVSDTFPLTVTAALHDDSGPVVSEVFAVDSDADLPLAFIIPDTLADGTYAMVNTFADLAGNQIIFLLPDALTVDSAAPAITQLATDPVLPVITTVPRDIEVDFLSDEFPLRVQFTVVDDTGAVADTRAIDVASQADLPVTYTLPAGLSEGTYTLEVEVFDIVDNSVVLTLGSLTVDTTAPTISGLTTDPAFPVTTTNGQDISIDFASDEFPLIVTFLLEDAGGTVVNTVGPLTLASETGLPLLYEVPAILPDGEYVLSMEVSDTAGNSQTITFGNIIIDSVGPVISAITTDPAFPVITNTDLDLRISFVSDTYPLTLTAVLVDESGADAFTASVAVGSENDIPVTVTIPGTLAEGTYTLDLLFSDQAGNRATVTFPAAVIMDRTAPVITALTTTPSLPFITMAVSQDIEVDFVSDEFPLTVQFTLLTMLDEGGPSNDIPQPEPITVSTQDDLPVIYTIPAGLAEGVYMLEMDVRDQAGNSVTIGVGSFTVDETGPLITDIATVPPLPFSTNGPGTIAVDFTSSEFPLDVTFTLFDDTGMDVDVAGPVTVTADSDLPLQYDIPDTLADGVYSLAMEVADSAGNSQTVTLGSVAIDTVAPVIGTITTDPGFPLFTNSEKDVTIDFTSDTFPLTLTVTLTNEAGSEAFSASFAIDSGEDIPVTVTIPGTLAEGTYEMDLIFSDEAGNGVTVNFPDALIVDLTAPVIANVTTDPALPFTNDGTAQEVHINFTSDEFPLTATVQLITDVGEVLVPPAVFDLQSDADLPFTYTIPAGLPEGTFTLELTVSDRAKNEVVQQLGSFDVRLSPQITGIVTNPIFPIANIGEEETLTVDFTSDRFPIDITFTLTDGSGLVVDTAGPTTLHTADDLPLFYTIPAGLALGEYTLTMSVEDAEGDITVITLGTLFVVEGDFALAFHQGWNLFSVPTLLEEDDVTTLFGDLSVDAILVYVDGDWQPVCGDCGITTIEPLFAYWVNLNEDAAIAMDFVDTSQQPEVPPSRSLSPGWEFVGVSAFEPTFTDILLAPLQEFVVLEDGTVARLPSYSRVFSFDGAQWNLHTPPLPGEAPLDEDILAYPGRGLWVFMEKEDELPVGEFGGNQE